ncbi:MAG: GNAT family N-acetyltransferase [Nitrospirae bacterium]|nr:GNAT family N-acetyltransferase [Candidatus Manganitrophaceae bacterium]
MVEAFLDHPPVGFSPLRFGAPARPTPAFLMSFGLLTSLDSSKKRLLRSLPLLRNLENLLRMPALFVGTTVSEYALYPPSLDPIPWIEALLEASKQRGSRLIILKDLPSDSPLLSEEENRFAADLLSRCVERGFFPLWGQALAYVKVDFDSMESYLQRQSAARRKNLRRKLKASASIEVEALPTGDERLCDPAFVETLFTLYMDVYRQSEIHFDQLTLPFFRAILQSGEANGVVFLYRQEGKLIGFNLCFVQGGNLIDKYIGFLYPEARAANLYFVSWFHNLEYAIRHRLKFYVAGWTDPEVKRFLGASFTFTRHAVYLHNPLLRALLKRVGRLFEADSNQLRAQRGPSALEADSEERGR